jgi:hypothetical protein
LNNGCTPIGWYGRGLKSQIELSGLVNNLLMSLAYGASYTSGFVGNRSSNGGKPSGRFILVPQLLDCITQTRVEDDVATAFDQTVWAVLCADLLHPDEEIDMLVGIELTNKRGRLLKVFTSPQEVPKESTLRSVANAFTEAGAVDKAFKDVNVSTSSLEEDVDTPYNFWKLACYQIFLDVLKATYLHKRLSMKST